MLEMDYDDPSKTFSGVQFVLLGFDLATEEKIRSKLVDGGGVDIGRYGLDCTHIIVGELVYDDPICVAARQEGKTLVTGLWVDHSFDIGMPVDPASILYRPLRDLNGIPGAKSLIVCLTGYQRQDREDIMTMVGLMGANFSKPLVANKVTHLICYKFEGEKYELAKKINTIKLVNHRWLEDCLRAWELLPEADYDKSGHELEIMQAQAKDSEDEAEDVGKKLHGGRGIVATPQSTRCGVRSTCQSLMMDQGTSRNILDVGTSSGMSNVGKSNETISAREETAPNHIQSKETPTRCSYISRSIAPGIAGKTCSGALLTSSAKSSNFENIGSPASASRPNRNSPPSGASDFKSIIYSPKTQRKASLPLDSGHVKSNADSIPTGDISKLHLDGALNISSSMMEHDKTILNGLHTPSKDTYYSHPEDAETGKLSEKRKSPVHTGSSKMQKTCHDSQFVSESGANGTEVLPHTPLIYGPHDTTTHHSHHNSYLGVNADLHHSPANISGIIPPEIVKECREKAPQTSVEKLNSINLDGKFPEAPDIHSNGPEERVDDATEQHRGPQNLNVPSPGAQKMEVQKSDVTAVSDIPAGGDANSRQKPPKRKLLAKKTLGPRPSLGRGKALNHKGSIHMNKKDSPRSSATQSIERKETEDLQRFADSEGLIVSPNSNVDDGKSIEMKSLSECSNQAPHRNGFLHNETEASRDKDNGLDSTICTGVAADIHAPNAVNTCEPAENVSSDKGRELSDSNLEDNAGGEKATSAKKRSLVKHKKKNLSPVTKVANSKNEEPTKGAKCKAKQDKTGGGTDRDKKPGPEDNGNVCIEMEKENIPLHFGGNNLNNKKQWIGKVTPKSDIKSMKTADENHGSVSAGQILKVKTEPVWFILSGHRLQRKEFQQVIKRLKGRVCRDTHQWSYQATHFIVPDPIRRTEKFFAAAASGRWILKTDYLTACDEAGKFLAEEPYEWHKNGLSEDGAINLEAPRKWRLLRERTGHGAFYGIRIIIYGDCIVPPLDTLKRVVKAGDGTILATSPPYTRFLQSGVDFAIVSPGMPRVDIWIQEFLRHEIPCVLADYLVEYVCKPGYSLDRHVQYNTHGWAEKSFKKLVDSMNEIVEDKASQEDDGITDIACQVCGSHDRGEVMLICGDEGGSRGCGIGTHIDCCDPPLQELPKEDWFCSKCSSKDTQKKSRKLTSASKKKR